MTFRTLNEGSLEAARYAVRDKLSPLIVGSEYALTLTDKRLLLDRVSPRAKVLFPWAGQWSTDVFILTVSEAKKLVAK